MIVKNLTAKDFRNLRDVSFSPCEKMNVIYGNNAQGKTNLLEAVYLFSGMKSFRGAKEKEFITFGEKSCKLDFSFETARRSKNAELIFGISGKSERKILLSRYEETSRVAENQLLKYQSDYEQLLKNNDMQVSSSD